MTEQMEEQQQNNNNIQQLDTRTHVVGELYDTERSYVESLQIIMEKYMKPLKSYDSNKNLIDSNLVDEIFYTIPEILEHHENFLSALQDRLSSDWDSSQVIGNVFIEAFTNQQIIDTYTAFINNWKNARHAIKLAIQAKPAFERFLEAVSREHRNKLTLDALLIMPVQRIPRYELLIKELIKHTPEDHPDHGPLIEAQNQIHKLALKIDRAEKEMLQQEQLRDIESLIEGHIELQHPQRDFIRYDLVTIPASTTLTAAKKERILFLFCDLLIMTSVKKKVSRRSNLQAAFSSSFNDLSLLEGNKFKLLLRVSLDQIDIKHEQKKFIYNEVQAASEQQQQQINESLINKRRQIESDLMLLQQIELLSTKLSLFERNDLTSAIIRISNQVHQDLVSIDYQQQQQQQENVDDSVNHRDLYVIQQKAATSASDLNSNQQQANNVEQKINFSSDQNTSLEFTIINFSTNKDERTGMSTNLSSLSMASDHSGDQQQQPAAAVLATAQTVDLNNTNSNNNVSQIGSNYETLVVTFMSVERRQAFLQAFCAAKHLRVQLQRGHHKIFSSSLALRMSNELQQQQMPVKSRSIGLGYGDARRTRLKHQDEVDLRHLEGLTASIRNNCSVHAPGGGGSGCITSARNASAPTHYSAYTNTIVHQMSAPHALASIADNCLSKLKANNNNNVLAPHCDTCSTSCILDSKSQDKQSNQNHHYHHHQHHHHHQLMHQPASQPAMLDTICCHDHHDGSGLISCSSQLSSRQDHGEQNQSLHGSNYSAEFGNDMQMKNSPSLQHHQAPISLVDTNSQRDSLRLSSLSLRFAPKFMLTIPMDFLTTQHPALQFTCSTTSKRQLALKVPSRQTSDRARQTKNQTVQDDLGQFWLCMSNGYVSHVALVSCRKKKVCIGSQENQRLLAGGVYTKRHQQQAKANFKLDQSFQCYDVIPVVESGGDICKSQINCAVHVGWSDGILFGREGVCASGLCADAAVELAGCEDETNKDIKQPTVTVKSASPPIDCKRREDNEDQMKMSRGGHCLSASAPSRGSTENEKCLANEGLASASSIKLRDTNRSPAEMKSIQKPPVASRDGCNFSHIRAHTTHGPHGRKMHQSRAQQRSLSPSCSHGYNNYAHIANNQTLDVSPSHTLGRNHGCGFYYLQQNQQHIHHNNNKNHHHPHYHGHSHQHRHLAQAGHHHHHHHHHHQHHNVYSSRHHTVPLAELRRALERQKRIVASDVEVGGGSREAASQRAYLNRLALPPNNTPYNFEKSSCDSSDGSERQRCSNSYVSMELRGSRDRSTMEKARSATPPARYFSSVSGAQKSFRSARMLRHQASLKTSSILAKLVGGATRGSSYFKRKNSSNLQSKLTKNHCTTNDNNNMQSDLDDNDTDTDNSALGQQLQGDRQTEDASSNDSSNVLVAAATNALVVPPLANCHFNHQKQQQARLICSNPNMNTSLVSPLSSASSINTTSSSLTVNSACASSHGRDDCTMLHQQHCRPAWSSMGCCAFDNVNTEQVGNGDIQCFSVIHQQKRDSTNNQSQCSMRARSATVPCRTFCHQDSFDHPDSYLLTKCTSNATSEAIEKRSQLRDDLLADRLNGRALNYSYKVSEILKDPPEQSGDGCSAACEPRELYYRTNSKETTSRDSIREYSDNKGSSSLWLGCEDGSLIVIDCLAALDQRHQNEASDLANDTKLDCRNIHCEIKFDASICDIKNHKDQIIFVALANGHLAVINRTVSNQSSATTTTTVPLNAARWSLDKPNILTMCQGETNSPSQLCLVPDRLHLWYSYERSIFVLNIEKLELVTTITTATSENCLQQLSIQLININHMELTKHLNGVWVSFKGSPLIQFYDCATFKLLLEMSLLEPINKVLSYGNEIIRQHKTACLGATSLLSVSTEDHFADESNSNKSTSLFIGTTAGIIIYLNVDHKQLKEHIEAEKSVWNPQVISLRHGHSGQVKFLRLLEVESAETSSCARGNVDTDSQQGEGKKLAAKQQKQEYDSDSITKSAKQLCLVSAGAGIDLYGPNDEQQVIQQLSGDEDCLNQLILWHL